MKSSLRTLICVLILAVVGITFAYAAAIPGDDLVINPPAGMKSKNDKLQAPVPFPHTKHAGIACVKCHHKQDAAKDATVNKCTDSGCHDSLEFRTSDNKDNIKLVENSFHTQCQTCHKDMKKAGKPTGPTACNKCHVKKS